MTRALACAATAVVILLVTAETAHAIPAFGRRYGVPCATCHSAITRRNEFGDAFRKAGYRWPLLADERAGTAPIEMRGVSAMRTLLPTWLPLAVTATMSAAYTNDPGVDDALIVSKPSLNLLFGGTLGDYFSFFGAWAGGSLPDELVLQLGRFWGRPEFNLRLGLIEQSTTMFKTNEALIARYILGTSSLHGHSVSKARMGAEANGVVLKRGFWAVGAVQNAEPGSNWDFYYHVSVKLGGMDFLGNEPEIDLAKPSAIQDLHVTLGHWGYAGQVEASSGEPLHSVRRYGFEGKLSFRDFSFLVGVMLGDDRDLRTGVDDSSLTMFGELTYPIVPWLFASYMYQYQDAQSFTREIQRHDFGVIVLPLENVRVRLKFTFTDDDAKNEALELQVFMAF